MSGPGLTVRELWRAVLPRETELIAGGGGLERRVEWATALRTRPPAFEAIKGGEIAFIPVARIRMLDPRLNLAKVIRSLGERGGSAVAVLGDISADSIEVADRMMVPLLRLPEDTAIAEAQENAIRHILDSRTLMHEREQELRVALMELALGGSEPELIIDRVPKIFDPVLVSAIWHTESGEIKHRSGAVVGDDIVLADFDAVRQWAMRTPMRAAEPPVHESTHDAMTRCVSPVPVRDEIGGYVTVVCEDPQLARLGAMRAASACAIDLERKRAVTAARDDIEGSFVETVVTGAYASPEAIAERAKRVGFEISQPHVVLLARVTGVLDSAVTAAKKWIELKAPGGLMVQRDQALCIVSNHAPPGTQALRGLANDLLETLRTARGLTAVSVAIGRSHSGIEGVKKSYREAEQALTLSRRIFGDGRAVSFDDLGLHRMLFSLRDHPEVRVFHNDQLGPLIEYDAKHNAGLIKTLEAYFQAHGSPTDAAASLGVHRNTVLYRLHRIEEVLGLSLDDPSVRLNLQLGLRLADVL